MSTRVFRCRAASRHHQMPRRRASTTCAIQKGTDHTGVVLPREFSLLRDCCLRSCNAEGAGRRLFVHALDSAECPTKIRDCLWREAAHHGHGNWLLMFLVLLVLLLPEPARNWKRPRTEIVGTRTVTLTVFFLNSAVIAY